MRMAHIGVLLLCVCRVAVARDAENRADDILKSAGRLDGLCVLADMPDPALAEAIARKSRFVVEVLHDDADTVAAMRKTIDGHGLSRRVSARESALSSGRLPYAENLVNLLVAGDGVAEAEAMRVLAPYGVAFLDGKPIRKPYPEAMDEWTHFRNKAEGNMVAQDTVVGPPRHVRWVSGPMLQRHHAMTPGTTVLVGAHGRIFYIQDESPIGFAGLPDKWRLVARDAFNGKTLWKRDMGPWGDTAWSWWAGGHGARTNHPYHVNKRLVASKDRVFVTLGYNAPVSALDPATGQSLLQYQGTEYADEMVHRDGVLYVSVNDREQKPLPGVGFSVRPTEENTSEKMVWAIEPITGEVLWKAGPYTGVSDKFDRLRSMKQLLLVASEKGVFLAADGEMVVGLDLRTGKERFRIAQQVSGKTSFLCHKGLLLIGDERALSAIDAETGEMRWQRLRFTTIAHIEVPEVFGIGDLVWIGDIKKMEIMALDLATGEVVKRHSIEKVVAHAGHHHRCYPNKSTVKYMITGRRGAEFAEYETGEVSLHHWARGECRYGHMPANGLLYKLPDPCTCHITAKLFGFYALASEKTAEAFFRHSEPARNPLRKGKAFGAVPDEHFSPARCWPMFRHDAMRSSSVKTAVPDTARTLWDVKVGAKLTPPVIAGGRVYVGAVDKHNILAFDEQSGRKLWTFSAGGRVDSPPSICGGMVLFGSADGWVYCLRAADGERVWCFRAAPYPRHIMDHDQVASAWPVHGSVLVSGGVAYVTAGRSAFVDGGIYLYALDAATGRVLGQNVIHEVQQHNRLADNKPKTMPEDTRGAASNILVSDGKDIYARYRRLDFGIPLRVGKADYVFPEAGCLNPQSSFFDDFWFHRLTWRYNRVNGNMIAFEEGNSYSAYMYKNPGSGQHKLYVPRGGDTTMIPDRNRVSEKETGLTHLPEIETDGVRLRKTGAKVGWQTDTFPVASLTMVVAENAFLVAGFANEVDPADPWANIEGRKGGTLWVLSKKDGKKRADYKLETLPVWNGMAVADGKIFISLKNGTLTCMGK
jgi:outer membrane protein assembly factor BamB